MDGRAPALKAKAGPEVETWRRGRILPVRAPFATTVWDYINRGMPLNAEGRVIPEDEVLDQQSLPKVKMPIGDAYADLPEWKPKTPRLKGYPY
jgi:hypothetical protein